MTVKAKGCRKRSSAPFCRLCAALALVLCMFITLPAGADGEVRALWVVRDCITTPQAVREVVDFADTCGFNLLFVQVRGRGDAYYQSYFVPGPEEFPDILENFDPLALIIELAHARDIEVHAWFNMFLAASIQNPPQNPLHLFNTHPSWFMVSSDEKNMALDPPSSFDNTIEGAYLSPGMDEVQSYLSRVITEVIVSYDIDGVHMDYIRFPGRSFDFNYRTRNRFFTMYGVDPAELVAEGDSVVQTFTLLEEWHHFRVRQVDEMVRNITRRITASGKRIQLSAAIRPEAQEAYWEFGQNWVGWLRENLVDFVVPMCYYPQTDVVADVLADIPPDIDRKRVIGGLGAYRLTPDVLGEQIALTQRMGLSGFSLFSYSSLAGDPAFTRALTSLPENW
ncbi:glycoside hydrolase family 10 protein [Candidatus Latescibacterota bacterium]